MKIKQTINDVRKWIVLVLIAIISFWAINNMELIISYISRIFNVLLPFLLGGMIAFVLDIPMSFLEKKLKEKTKLKNITIRTISIILSLLIFALIFAFIAFLLVPELIENIKTLISNIPTLFNKTETFIIDLLDKFPDIQTEIKNFFSTKGALGNIITDTLNYFLNGTIGLIGDIISGIVMIITSLIFAIYMLSQKEYLCRCVKKVLFAILSKKNADKVINIGKITNNTFTNFISGQCVEISILGGIMFIVLTLFKFPYALVISVLTSITALVPIFGAIIAMVVGAILIAITNPIKALLFILVFQIIQQIENNLIYPKVVGKSVGLSPMWTLFAISIGGSLFGIIGAIIGLPLASIIYSIIKENVDNKLKEKNIKI